MKFPTETFKVGDCIAVWRTASGTRKVAGPITEGRPGVLFGGEVWKASRLSFHLNHSELPRTPMTLKEGIVCHACDNAWCINPDHLYLGTAKQNTADIYERNKEVRGRQSEAARNNKNNLGREFSPEWRENLSKAKIGNTNKKGKKESEETKRKKSEAQKARWMKPGQKEALSKGLEGNSRRKDHLLRTKGEL